MADPSTLRGGGEQEGSGLAETATPCTSACSTAASTYEATSTSKDSLPAGSVSEVALEQASFRPALSKKGRERLYRKKRFKALRSFTKNRKVADANEVLSDEPSRVLYVIGMSAPDAEVCAHVEGLLRQFEGFCGRLYLYPECAYGMTQFDTAEHAAQARTALLGYTSPELRKQMLFLEFASDELRVDPQSSRDAHTQVPGLYLMEEYISEEYERQLLDSVEQCPWTTMRTRSVQHHGYEYDYIINGIHRDKRIGPLPAFCDLLLKKFADTPEIPHVPDQLTVNKYSPGAGIAQHVDTHSMFTDGLLSLTTGSYGVMEMRHPDGRHVSVMLPRRSLLVMTGEARYVWSHSIAERHTDYFDNYIFHRGERVSFTFRKIRPELDCDCQYDLTWQCDTWLKKTRATRVEQKYVYETYDAIAEHFSDTRHSPWPKIEQFLKDLPAGSLVADIGCGNGKYLGCNKDLICIGTDRSPNLIEIAHSRGHEVGVQDILQLNFRDNLFDVVISIAVVHHLSTPENRLTALRELTRIARPGGLVLVYVWAFEQRQRKFKQQDVFVPWKMDKKYIKRPDQQKFVATLGSENSSRIEFQRFYHVFKEGELEELVEATGELSIVESYFDHANWCVLAKKHGDPPVAKKQDKQTTVTGDEDEDDHIPSAASCSTAAATT